MKRSSAFSKYALSTHVMPVCIALALGLSPAWGADNVYLGPLTVKLVSAGADGKVAPIAHETVWINARHADTDAQGAAIFDGVPVGRHSLKVGIPGYAAVERVIDLAAGTRAAIEINVPRTPPVTWEGNLVDAVSGLPVVGASVDIRPVDVAAALRGGGTAISDWDGVFRFVNLPPGRYALTAKAGGFQTFGGEYAAAARTGPAREFAQPMLDGVALDICLNWGSACGKPAADAFCRKQGMAESLEHKVRDNAPPTRIISSGKLCEGGECDRIDWIRCAAPNVTANLAMTPISAPTRAELKVLDARGRQPIAGARVTLAEAWPSGEIAQGSTGAQGSVVFANLKTGPVNWPDAEGKLLMARKRVTARIEADGYIPDVVPVSLGQASEALLTPTAEQAEVEPNDLTSPQDVLHGAPIRFAIGDRRDHDAFRFRLVQPSRVVITVGPGNPLQTHLRIRDGDAKLLRENGAYAGNDNRIELRLAAGTYYAEVSEWGEDASGPDKPMTLRIDVTPATDPSEPNDSLQQATPIALGEQVAGLIWPVGDHDFYRLEIPRPGMLRILEPGQEMERHIRLLDGAGKLSQERGVYSRNAFDMTQRVEAGTYYVQVMEWGGDNASLAAYRLRLIYMPDDGIDDPPLGPGNLSAKRVLSVPETVHATIMPRGDIDVYAVALAGAGTLQVRSQGNFERHAQIFDRTGKLLTEQGVYSNNENQLSWQVAGPDTLYVAIREWGMDAESPTPYALSAWFEPADEFDFLQRNDDFDHATPIAPGETVRGSYDPRGDRDYYVLDADFPGILRVKVKSGMETHLRIYDGNRRLVTEQGVYANNMAHLAPNVAAGTWYVVVGEWGDDRAGTVPYELTAELERAEPGEAWPMTGDAPRRLVEGVAQAFSFDHNNDIDRFIVDFPGPGKGALSVVGPLETHVRIFDDQTGKMLHESGHYAPTQVGIPLDFKHPTRLRVELMEWGQDRASFKSGFVMFDTRGRAISAARVVAKATTEDPLRVVFQREAPERGEAASRCDIDVNRDGRAELSVTGDQTRDYRFAEAGLYDVESVCYGNNGLTSRQRIWVQTTLPREKRGVALFLPAPAQGQVLAEAIDLRAHATSYDGRRIARVDYALDGRHLASDYSAPYEATPAWLSLPSGQHTLAVSAWDDAGNKAELRRQFVLSEFFGLTPPDGAVLTGENARVAWTGQDFGEARVRYRQKGETAWREAVGQSGRQRSVVLAGLEAGKPYEFQPLGATEGPLRTLTRVKGLAFSEARYGANIRRDYDQKVAISVRNNGDKPLKVRLECAKPADPLLLVGFVGEGSEDKPIDLGPGESRQFVLGISAQDVTRADHVFAVRMVADSGLSDEAEVAVHVKLPRVELAWEDKGPAADGQGRVYRLVNKADSLTDLEVTAAHPDKVNISPTVRHGLLQAGQHRDFTVSPRYYEGFTGVETQIKARALDKEFVQAYSMALAPGESARRVWLLPGMDGSDAEAERQAIDRAERAVSLNPKGVDWRRRDNPEDTDGDGRMDRWSHSVGDVLWVGDDTDNDGQVDFVHADVGADEVFEYSAVLENGQWRPTNMVEAWLEMGFALPWSRSSYKEHDAEIVLNGVVVGQLKDTIPEGNYAFRIPPRALKFDDSGKPGENQVGIRSKHLRGGHYVINSDFRFKFRLTATPVWTVAKSEAEARANAAKLNGASTSGVDFSVSSAETRLVGPANPKAGDEMSIEVLARNLGAATLADVPVALVRASPSGAKEELARIVAAEIKLHGATPLRIPFKARGGANTLSVVIDPDNAGEDGDRANNSASVFMRAAGDDKAPTLQVEAPTDGQASDDGLIELVASAADDQGLAGVYVSIDGGLWQDLGAENGKARRELLLQPGEHRLAVKAVDYSDNVSERKLSVRSNAKAPALRVLAPTEGARIDAREARLELAIPNDAALVAARAAGGPWYRVAPSAPGQARFDLPLKFGAQRIEVLAADANGLAARAFLNVDCLRQPSAAEAAAQPDSDSGVVWPALRPGHEIDLFKNASGLLALADPEALARAERAREDASRLAREREAARAEATRLAEQAEAERLAAEAAGRAEAERRAEAVRQRAEIEARERRETEARLAAEREAETLRAQEAERVRLAAQRQAWEDAERQRREAEAARLAEAAELARQARADEERRRQEDQARLAREEQARRVAEDEARLAREIEARRLWEEQARLAREEAERLRQELDRERARNAQAGRAYTAAPVAPPVPVTPPAPVTPPTAPTATWPGTPAPPAWPAQPAPPVLQGKVLLDVASVGRLASRPKRASKFEVDTPHIITLIRTTHWNEGRGAPPGLIALQCRDGRTYGPWQAHGTPDARGIANAVWVVAPNAEIPATTCSVAVSDPDSWSHADDTKNRGLTRVEGLPVTDARIPAQGQPAGQGTLEKADEAMKGMGGTLDKLQRILDLIKK